ncbi:MAG: GerMN domain-containing protein [Methylocystaceae bacterium]
MRHRRILFLTFLLLLIISGCSLTSGKPPAQHSIRVKLYFGSSGNERMVYETHTINYNNASDKYLATLNALLAGPQDPKLVANIASGTHILNITRSQEDLTVNLSREFLSFAGSVGETVAVGSIVNTLVQFPEISRVKILVAGKELVGPSGMNRGFMTEFTNNYEPAMITHNIVLYFADPEATAVHPEPRQIRINPNISDTEFIKVVLLELISGPTSGTLCRTIPREVNIRSVVKEGDLVKVDFSSEMVTKHWGGAAGEAMTVNSLTATLTELPGIKRVLLTVEGKPMTIEHMVVDQPLTRNPDMIKPQVN